MRVWLATAAFVGILLIITAVSRPSAQGQNLQAGITPGEKLGLAFEANGAGRPCTVIDVRGDFVGCRVESRGIGRPATEEWYNLRLVQRIDRTVAQQ